jgi:hypothetical protein
MKEICEICKIECNGLMGVTTHLRYKHQNEISLENYYLKYIWKNDKPEYAQIHSIKNNPGDNIAKWFKETLINQEYLKVKNMTFKPETNNLIKSFINTPVQPEQPEQPEQPKHTSVESVVTIKDDNEICSVKFKLLSRQEYKR